MVKIVEKENEPTEYKFFKTKANFSTISLVRNILLLLTLSVESREDFVERYKSELQSENNTNTSNNDVDDDEHHDEQHEYDEEDEDDEKHDENQDNQHNQNQTKQADNNNSNSNNNNQDQFSLGVNNLNIKMNSVIQLDNISELSQIEGFNDNKVDFDENTQLPQSPTPI